jgi:hypothetical protein
MADGPPGIRRIFTRHRDNLDQLCRRKGGGSARAGVIRMKLSIDNCCKFNGFMLLSQTCAEYLRCCASFSRGLGRQTFCGGTGTGEKAAEYQLGLKDRLHPPIGQSLEMSDEFEQTQFTFFLQPQGMTQLWAQRIIEQNEEHAAIEIT